MGKCFQIIVLHIHNGDVLLLEPQGRCFRNTNIFVQRPQPGVFKKYSYTGDGESEQEQGPTVIVYVHLQIIYRLQLYTVICTCTYVVHILDSK